MSINVKYTRGDTAFIAGTTIQDGQLLYNTVTGQHYEDVGTTRKEVGKIVDTTLSTTSTNAVANRAITGSIVNTLAEVNAITANSIPCGTKPLKELSTSLDWIDITSQGTWSSLLDVITHYYAKVNPRTRMVEVSCILNAGRADNGVIYQIPVAYQPPNTTRMVLGQTYDRVRNMDIVYYVDNNGAIRGSHTTAGATTGISEVICFNFTY